MRAKYYQSQIRILRWAVELGRVDIITEVSTPASHLALPREGHLDALFQIYAYLKKRHNSHIVLDPTYLNEPQGEFIECNWREFYGNVKEPIPPNAPRPLGKEVDLRLYTDLSHADDKLTRRSHTGYFVFMNMALINWMSKKQATVETSSFGAEFVALKHGITCQRPTLQAQDDGSLNIRTNGHLWTHYECHKERPTSRIDIEEEIKLNLLPCITRIGRNE